MRAQKSNKKMSEIEALKQVLSDAESRIEYLTQKIQYLRDESRELTDEELSQYDNVFSLNAFRQRKGV